MAGPLLSMPEHRPYPFRHKAQRDRQLREEYHPPDLSDQLDDAEEVRKIPINRVQQMDGTVRLERQRTVCFFLPLRSATMILTALCMVGTLDACITSMDSFSQVVGKSSDATITFLFLRVLLYSLLFFISVLGFFGSIFSARPYIEIYADAVWIHLWSIVIIGLVGLGILSSGSQKAWAIVGCLHSTKYVGQTWNSCQKIYQRALYLNMFFWAMVVFIELWCLLVVCHYIDELYDEEELAKGVDIYRPAPSRLRRKAQKRAARMSNANM